MGVVAPQASKGARSSVARATERIRSCMSVTESPRTDEEDEESESEVEVEEEAEEEESSEEEAEN